MTNVTIPIRWKSSIWTSRVAIILVEIIARIARKTIILLRTKTRRALIKAVTTNSTIIELIGITRTSTLILKKNQLVKAT
jgi:superfamily I DNA and RNA helicase